MPRSLKVVLPPCPKISGSNSFQWSPNPEQLLAPCPPAIPACLSNLATCLQCWVTAPGWVSSLRPLTLSKCVHLDSNTMSRSVTIFGAPLCAYKQPCKAQITSHFIGESGVQRLSALCKVTQHQRQDLNSGPSHSSV